MLLQKSFAAVVLCALLFTQTFAQKPPAQTNANEISPALKKEALAFLRETIKDIPKLKATENRQYFSIISASLLSDYDETQSRAMLQAAANDLRQSLAQISAEVAKSESINAENRSVYASNSAYDSYYRLSSELRWRIQRTLAMRRTLLYALAETNPQMADDFLQETARTIAASKFIDTYGTDTNNEYLEKQIAVQTAKKDADKAANIARRMFSRDFSPQAADVLDEIYKQNPDKGSQLAEEILQKLKASSPPKAESYKRNAFALQFLRMATASLEQSKSTPGKKPLLAESSVRELANYVGQTALNESNFGYVSASEVVAAIEKYAPQRAAQLRSKRGLARQKSGNTTLSNSNVAYVINSNVAVAVNSNVVTNTVMRYSNTNISTKPEEIRKYRELAQKEAERQKRIKAERDAVLDKIKQKTLSAEDKTFVVEQVRKFASQAREREQKIGEFIDWAMQSAAAGNLEIAETLMREAETLASSQPKNARDYMSKWALVYGYSSISPDKSFATLENIVPPFNEIISSFVKVAEFIDDGEEIFADGEILMGGGPRGASEFFGSIPRIEHVARNLAKADFDRMKSLTGKFERLEFRTMARMIVLKNLLKPEDEAKRPSALRSGYDNY